MNILLVADVSIAKVCGGAERVLYEESTRLARRGHSVHIITRRLAYHEKDVESIDGVEERRYLFQEKPLPICFKSILSNCRQTFYSLHENSNIHLINFHQPFSSLGVLASKASGSLPKVYTCHSLSFQEYISRQSPPKNPALWLLYRFQILARKAAERGVLQRSDCIVVLSDYTREKLENIYGLLPPKVRVIPGGVDLERFTPPTDRARIRAQLDLPEEKFILFTVRNLVPRMGLENLIAAFEIVLTERRDLLLVIGGEGPLYPILKERAEKSGISEFVRFVGFIPDEKLPNYYHMADLFVLPTKELEGFGLVTVEALASGLPVLGTPVGGTKEILSKLGPDYLFDNSTPESMAASILETLNSWGKDRTAYENISESCRRVAEQYYSWDNHVTQLENLFYELRDL